MKITAFSILSAAAFLGTAHAGTLIPSAIKHNPSQCFYAGETTLDAISVYVDPRVGGDAQDGFGGGLSLSHFYTERFGAMFRAYWWDTPSVIHSIQGSAVFRQPIQHSCVAPHLIGGVGGHFNSTNDFSFHAGAGLEVRLTERWGIVSDYSYTWVLDHENWHMVTLGLRYIF